MNISIIGTGYVGLVSGACFAEVGNSVLCMDLDERKISELKNGQIRMHEPGLAVLVQRSQAQGRLRFSSSYAEALDHADVIIIAVGTPAAEDGSADLSHTLAAARAIGRHLMRPAVVVVKSTVPVGTAHAIARAIDAQLARRQIMLPFQVVSNPEFLKEGDAVDDFMRPDRIVVGSDDRAAATLMRELYQPFNRQHDRLIEMDVRSAELTKYAANAMLAARISYMNELACLAEALGADIEAVRQGMGADPRIGPHCLQAGAGYGGSCFPKDVRALLKTANEHQCPLAILSAVQSVNEAQKNVLFHMICSHFGGVRALEGLTIAVWGLAFKPETDDMREAPSLVLIGQLLAAGCRVKAYDPAACEQARQVLGEHDGTRLQLCASAHQAIEEADALALVTEWQEFHAPDFDQLARMLRHRAVFDGRNLYHPQQVRRAGLAYHGIGRLPHGGLQ